MPETTTATIEANRRTPRFRDAFERLTTDIRAVPKEQFLQINIDVPHSVSTVLGAWPAILRLRAEIMRHMPTFDIAILDHLESQALALGHAQTLYETATARTSLAALATETERVRAVFLAEIKTQTTRGIIDPQATKDLKWINGYKNVAFDVLALSNILRNSWSKLAGRTSVTLEELDAAEILAEKLIAAVGERRNAPAAAAEAASDRQGAFTLLIKAYDEVRVALAYLRRKEGDCERIAPSLYLGRRSGKANKKRKLAESTVPTDTTNTTTIPAVTNDAAPIMAAPTVTENGPYMH